MFEDKINKVKALISKDKTSKKKIENLVVFIVILVITIIIIKTIWKSDSSGNKKTLDNATLANNKTEQIVGNAKEKNDLEENLENILNKIEGVGNVKVMVTYSQTSKTVPMYNEDNIKSDTEENDKRRRYKKNK